MTQPAVTDLDAPRVELRDIALRYPERSVLNGVRLAVRPGELVSVLGASGSGKSTLLRIVAGLLKPTSGDVLVDGAALDGPRPDVALAFQDPCLLPWLSVERNVAFGLGFARQPKLPRGERNRRVTAALDEVGLAHARHYAPRQLSGGMAQRAALARCLARQPRTLLLDEPFGALDEVTRADMQRLLVKVVRDTGAATILVTHDIDEALRVSDRIVLLGREGKLLLHLPVDVPAPRDAHVAALGALRVRILAALHASMARAEPAPAPSVYPSPARP
ncbi:ABC transporter ATP-binding protein [Paraburkholderia caballeronis]|uniref:NitT/TauT family transport system ATP-binding protein n=1 Tax=Paraburkholderia caballeronis TaxID=416943 RepID=A0A1H7FM43_9BURK|nr:ABC transporter ATP-binding protein [Paraburkholderia caballeronis]PXW24922.1 NitT/TauT family transport system ATP-binding protein [Paraburkholderia caballeronis]PXX00652.1 NitT/TauT family transport system ATP-binding protein [Paraburkholderia caballeronis]RAJ98715.1 NitT/TauT family transport system ATP-binding protein [Paraburkholderia caballeronis]SEE70839.1 NitT/TauT family transport system ATP-binding protein [Paraburkholderia caballeronis]SEK27059.1 NitT/TauT family transport system